MCTLGNTDAKIGPPGRQTIKYKPRDRVDTVMREMFVNSEQGRPAVIMSKEGQHMKLAYMQIDTTKRAQSICLDLLGQGERKKGTPGFRSVQDLGTSKSLQQMHGTLIRKLLLTVCSQTEARSQKFKPA